MDLLMTLCSLSFLAAIMRWTVPLALASTGGLLSEKSGVINIALEGLMISGAFAGACGAYYGGGALAGIICGVTAGTLLALLYAWMVVRIEADQIVTGVALNLLAEGLSRYLLKVVFGSTANSKELKEVSAMFSSSTLGRLMANPLVWATVVIAVAVYFMLARTRFGLRIRAAGDHPAAAEALGVDVARVRLGAVALSGALAGLGGVWLVTALHGFSSGMIGGRGYIALAALIFAGWRPLPVLGAAALFGFFQALSVQLRLEPAVLAVVPEAYLQMLPYVLVLALVLWPRTRRGFGGLRVSRAPAALGKPMSEHQTTR
jgi:general nucleoside transport system permease protein